jgi:hypothetical protein
VSCRVTTGRRDTERGLLSASSADTGGELLRMLSSKRAGEMADGDGSLDCGGLLRAMYQNEDRHGGTTKQVRATPSEQGRTQGDCF